MMTCYYCELIAAADPSYPARPAEFDLGSEAPRCAWHWRFLCDHCGQAGHFMTRFYCARAERLLCRDAGPVHSLTGDFWAWQYRWMLECPECGDRHPSLDSAEFAGQHPWQIAAGAVAARRWLSADQYLIRYPHPSGPRILPRFPRVDLRSVTDADVDVAWSANADLWEAGYDERGDRNRKYQSDPVLLAFLGDVSGQRILDAGSGTGYLSRLLARRGAGMVAVENARRFHEIALDYQAREPLDIEFHRASISSMPFLDAATFDAVVANYVLMDVRDLESAIAEIARVLRPGGRFVCAISHQTFESNWHVPASDSPRQEDRVAWIDDDYFIRRAGRVRWGGLQAVSFVPPTPARLCGYVQRRRVASARSR